jgi:WD40-like Beta Propeller Repeat
MNTLEDRLRAAARAAADTVPPHSAPPLRLRSQPAARRSDPGQLYRRGVSPRLRSHPRQPRNPGFPGRGQRGGWPRALAPLAAAASVITIVTVSLALGSGAPGRQPGRRGAVSGAASHQPWTPARTARSATALASVPPYYVTVLPGVMATTASQHAVIRATVTGKVVATVAVPSPYNTFGWVTAADDDRTFVLTAQRWVQGASTAAERLNASAPTKFFLLRLDPGTHATHLSALPIRADPGSVWVDGIALSPDGTRLAVAADRQGAQGGPKIQLFDLATGSAKEWVWPGNGWIGNNKPIGQPLSWAADGRTLAFQLGPRQGTIAVRLLDTATPGGSLRSSKLAVEWNHGGVTGPRGVVIAGASNAPANSLASFNTLITPDGTKIVCVTTTPSVTGQISEFSLRAGQFVRLPGTQPGSSAGLATQDVLWTNSSGSTLIVQAATTGVLAANHFTPIPGAPPNTLSIAW